MQGGVNNGFTTGFKIVSEFDAKGIEQAKAGLAQVDKAAVSTSTAMTVTGVSSTQMTGKIRQTAAAGAALSAALGQGQGGLSAVCRGLGAVLGGLAAGPVGLVVAGIALIVGTISAFKAKHKELAEELQKGRMEFQKLQGDRIAAQYKRIAEGIDTARKAQDALNAAYHGVRSAEVKTQIVSNEIRTREEISKASTPEAKEQAKLQGDIRRVEIDNADKRASADNDLIQAQKRLADARKKEAAAAENADKAREQFNKSGQEAKVHNQELADKAEKDWQATRIERQIADKAVIEAANKLQAVTLENANAIQAANQAAVKHAQEAQADLDQANYERASKAQEAAGLQDQINTTLKAEKAAQEAITNAAKQAAKAEAKGKALDTRRTEALTARPEDFIADRNAKRDAKTELSEAQTEAAKKANRLQSRKDRGVKLSDENKQWLIDYNDQQQLGKQGRIQKAFDLQKAWETQEKTQTKQLDELKGIRADLQKALSENGGN